MPRSWAGTPTRWPSSWSSCCRWPPGVSALDVGCGPGTVTGLLAAALGADHVIAVDPSAQFVEAARARCPGVDVRQAVAESLPFPTDAVDVAVAQLVVHFMTDSMVGLREMARVVVPGGVVAASVWDHAGGRGPLSPFWRGVQAVSPPNQETGEGHLPGAREGELVRLFREAGLRDVVGAEATVTQRYASFEDWWTPYTLGVGTAGDHLARLSPAARKELEAVCRRLLPPAPFEIEATAWVALGAP